MAKRRRTSGGPTVANPKVTPTRAAASKPITADPLTMLSSQAPDWPTMPEPTDAGTQIPMDIPIRELSPGYSQTHVDVQNLTRLQADTLRRIREELQAGHAQLATGRHVDSAADVVRWWLDMVARCEHEQET